VDCFEKKYPDNNACFFDTDKRHIRVFQKKGERDLKRGWRGNSTVLVGWEEKETRRVALVEDFGDKCTITL
jgi:hypothetical protein